jgi:hypothetical protein
LAKAFKPPSTQRAYDVCVIGSHVGGLAAGALLARRGYRVLLVEHEAPGGSYEDGGYLLPSAPLLLPQLRSLPSAEAVLGELGLASDAARLLEPVSPTLQIVLPRHRLDLPREPAARAAELRREWPADGARLEAALAELQRQFDAASPFLKAIPPLPPEGLRERWAMSRARRAAAAAPGAPPAILDQARPLEGVESHPLSRALLSFQRFLGHLDGDPAPLGLVRLLGGALRGTHRMAGGPEALRDLLRRRIVESRGDLAGGDAGPATARALELEGRRATAVRLAGSNDVCVARAFVVSIEAGHLLGLFPAGAPGRLRSLLEKVAPVRELLALNLVVRAEALPPPLGEALLIAPGADEPRGADGAVLAEVLPARRGMRKGAAEPVPGERVICAASFVRSGSGPDDLSREVARLRSSVAEAVPFFERHLLHESAPALVGAPAFRAAHPLYRPQPGSALGVCGLPSRLPLKNLFCAGREVVPGLGLEGEFQAALQVVARVAGLLGSKGKRK